MRPKPLVGRIQLTLVQQTSIRPYVLPAKAEPAIDRTDEQRLEQRPVGIAMHDPLYRGERVIGDRIGRFVRGGSKLGRVGHELETDRIIGSVDERADGPGDRHGIARRHRRDRLPRLRRDQACAEQRLGIANCR